MVVVMRLGHFGLTTGLLLAVTALAACGGGSGDDDDTSAAGSAGMPLAGTGGSGVGGSAGTANVGGSAGSAGKQGGAGGGAGQAAAGMAGSAGTVAGAAGQGATMLTPLSSADDPSRISALPECALAQGGTCIVPITRTKDEVCQKFASDWPKQAPSDYTLPDDHCTPATIGSGAEADALRRVNLYRWLAALGPLTVNDEWSTHAAACSIIQAHLDDINHYPPADSTCYTELGGGASSESLLDIGAHTPADTMDDLIWDWGQRNYHELGHRWWLLHPGLTEIGLGFSFPADGRRATCVRDTAGEYIDRPADLTGAVAYPNLGRSPYELIDREAHARPVDYPLEWSLTLSDAIDITAASARAYRETASGYASVEATSGPIDSFHGLWIDLAEEPAPGTYLVLVSGTGIGDFGYRSKIERCGADAPLTCDVLAQDCGVAGYGCYEPDAPFCSKSGGIAAGMPCKGNLPSECAKGSVCVPDDSVRDGYTCAPYCDAIDPGSEQGCSAVCPGNYIYLADHQTNEIAGGYCDPSTGKSCDPLAPECPSGQGCYAWEPSVCFTAGTIAKGQPCQYTNDCAPGLACIDFGDGLACLPYCDPTIALSAKSCETLCPGNAEDHGTFAICMQ
jgi:hypothetical protein